MEVYTFEIPSVYPCGFNQGLLLTSMHSRSMHICIVEEVFLISLFSWAVAEHEMSHTLINVSATPF